MTNPVSNKTKIKERPLRKKTHDMAIMLMEILEEKGSSSLGLDAIETDVSQILREVRKMMQ